ncbi:recombinase family protein [Aeriscardovia aeriphila]|uniref:recombinase family protein n=1 Tax=Aeriscardovia aeriphila TaxID=218139 RepID=UPI001B80D2BF
MYNRVSTKLQVEKGESIDAQRFELTRYAENHNMRVLGEYIDDGFSGKSVQGRPQFR